MNTLPLPDMSLAQQLAPLSVREVAQINVQAPTKRIRLYQFAASPEDMAAAPCLARPYTQTEIIAWVQKNLQSVYRVSEKVNGIQFEDENPVFIDIFRELTTRELQFSGREPYHPQKIFTSKCTKVSCAIAEIFGAEEGFLLFYILGRFGINMSHYAHGPTYTKPFKLAELRIAQQGFAMLPPHLHPFGASPRRWARASNGGPGVAANQSFLYDAWNYEGDSGRTQTILHETAHFFGMPGLDIDPLWLKVGGWEIKDNTNLDARLLNPALAVSQYGRTNSAEDFAETFIAYRFRARALKQISPLKYEFMRLYIFDGIEFTDEESCRRPPNVSSRLRPVVPVDFATIERVLGNDANCYHAARDFFGTLGASEIGDASRFALSKIQSCYSKKVWRAELLRRGASNQLTSRVPIYNRLSNFVWSPPTYTRAFAQALVDPLVEALEGYERDGRINAFTSKTGERCPASPYSFLKFQKLATLLEQGRVGNQGTSHVLHKERINAWAQSICHKLHDPEEQFRARTRDELKAWVQTDLLKPLLDSAAP